MRAFLAALMLMAAAASGAAAESIYQVYHVQFMTRVRCDSAVCAQWSVCPYDAPSRERTCPGAMIDRVELAIVPRPRDTTRLERELADGCWLVSGRVVPMLGPGEDLGGGRTRHRRELVLRVTGIAAPEPLNPAPERCAR